MSLFDAMAGNSSSQDQAEEGFSGLPSYLVAADNHSIANNNQTFLEGAAETISSIPKFIGASIISGANEIYNIAPSLGNFMGGEFEISKAADVISSMDEDLGVYYQEHAESVDVGGFILSSLVSGMAGVKVLNAGQKVLATSIKAGSFGKNMSAGLGLLVPSRQKYLSKAISEITDSNSLSLLTNKNTLLAMSAGYGQAVLETAAFEVAVASALSSSPVLENQDVGDIVTNIAIGGLAFGTIGGVIDITKSSFALKKAVTRADIQAAPVTNISVLHSNAPASNKILHDIEQAENLKNISMEQFPVERRQFLGEAAKTKASTLEVQIRTELGNLAAGDQIVASQVFAMTKGTDFNTSLGNYLGATRVSRITDMTAPEKLLTKVDRQLLKGSAKIKDVEAAAATNFRASYVNTWGDNIGEVVFASSKVPQHVALSDTLKKGEEILVTPKGVTAGKLGFNFTTKGVHDTSVVVGRPVKGVKGTITPAKGTEWDVKTAGLHESQARAMWAAELPPFVSGKEFKSVTIGENDTHLIDKLFREFDPRHKIAMLDGSTRSFANPKDLMDFIYAKKISLANELLTSKSAVKGILSQEDIASTLNIRSTLLSGEVSANNLPRDVFAIQSYSEDYTKLLVAKGLHKEVDGIIPVYKLPKTLKMSYDTTVMKDIDGNILEGMAIITQQERIQSQKLNNVLGGYLAADYNKFLEIGLKDIEGASRAGAGPGLVSFASANPGTLASKMEWVGKSTIGVIEKKTAALKEAIEPALYKLAQNKEAVVEWSNLSAKLRALPDTYVLNATEDALEPAVVANYNAATAAGKKMKPPTLKATDAPVYIPIRHAETIELVKAHIAQNGRRVTHEVELRTTQGHANNKNPEGFYPPPVDPKEYPFFAIVVDDSITGTGHHSTIYANSEAQLAEMIAKVKTEPTLTVHTKGEAERYYKSIGQYDSQRSLNENYINTTLQRKGVSSPYFVPTDPQKVTQDLLSWHVKQETNLVREMVSAKYERQFGELMKRGSAFTDIATSKYNSLSMVEHAEAVVKNPYVDYIKTGLGLKNNSDYPFWTSANRALDSKVSEMYDRLTKVVESSKSVDDLADLDGMMKRYGYKGAAYDMDMDLLANHTAPKGVLLNFVQNANALLATVVIRLDFMNAAINALSANILYGTEMNSVLRAIESGDSIAAGAFTALAKIKVPGTDQFVLSPGKIYANAVKAFGTDNADMAWFKENGFITSISSQQREMVDTLTLTGKESIQELGTGVGSKLEKVRSTLVAAANKGEKWTGNKLAEEFNRFIAAHSMKQMTDLAITHGVMDSKTALSYINTFVNRTQGNYLAAQRPMLFQGAIGQSIGLFQTYQFNLMQQLLRHVGEGSAKDSMTLLGLQGTIFGLNGLPAFNAINTHIIGTASGNTQHKDAYTAVYGAAGKDAGDWLMYGLSSNMLLHPDLKTNMYVRGDINPRHVTIIPTNPADVPVVGATAKFFGNLFTTAGKIVNGGDFATSILQGIEHNGISRPLAGLAQTLEGFTNPNYASYSTSKRGNVIASNDLLSLANISRMVGGKPLGEAVAIDAAFRFKSYALADHAKKDDLGQAIKSNLIAGQQITTDQIEKFAEDYAKIGGKQTEFNKWVVQLYKTANSSQANDLRDKVSSPYSKSMQLIMGGYELKDFEN